MATSKKTEIATAASGEMMFAQDVPEWAKNSTGRGSENVGATDIVLPRLEIVQAQSPIKDTNEAAREGMLFNSATSDLLGTAAFIIPIYYRMEYIIWKDQEKGGGFFGSFDTEGEARQRLHEAVANGEDEADLEIVDTPVHYCLRVREDMTTEQVVISMAKSKSKVSRKWNAMIQIAGGDRFSRVYKLSTFKDKNKKNQSFWNFVVTPAGFPPENIYREAERLYGIFKEQRVKADHAAGGAYGPDETEGNTEI